MRLISIKNAKPGDILGQAVLNSEGGIMLKENVVLTENYINRLASLGIYTIYIEDKMLDDILPQDPKFLEIKSQAVKTLSKIFSRLEYSDKCLDLKNTQLIDLSFFTFFPFKLYVQYKHTFISKISARGGSALGRKYQKSK